MNLARFLGFHVLIDLIVGYWFLWFSVEFNGLDRFIVIIIIITMICLSVFIASSVF